MPALFACELRRLASTPAENALFVIFKRTNKSRLIAITTRPERHQAMATNHEDQTSS
jgi:hypothetical protein